MGRATRKLEKRYHALSTQVDGLVARGRRDDAMACLDEALVDKPGWNAPLMGAIATAASGILARVGRVEDAASADECVVLQARDAARASGSPADRTRLAGAVATWAMHLNATGTQGSFERAAECLAESRALDPAAAVAEIERWQQAQSQAPPLTLAAALHAAAERPGGTAFWSTCPNVSPARPTKGPSR